MTADPRKVDGRFETARFQKVGFDRFRELARDPALSPAEKMGAARGLREGFDDAIWASMLLIGDIPNFSKLRRFLSSGAGVAYHREYMKTEGAPQVPAFAVAIDRIDDGMLLGLVMRARLAGFDAYLLPQPENLAIANRREHLLIQRP